MKPKEINTDNQALLLEAWFLRGFPREKQEVKTLLYGELCGYVHYPLSPPEDKSALQSQSPLQLQS